MSDVFVSSPNLKVNFRWKAVRLRKMWQGFCTSRCFWHTQTISLRLQAIQVNQIKFLKNSKIIHSLNIFLPKNRCKFCGQQFAQITSMKVHVRLHTSEKPYNCSLCPLSFVSRTYLNTHMKKHNTATTKDVVQSWSWTVGDDGTCLIRIEIEFCAFDYAKMKVHSLRFVGNQCVKESILIINTRSSKRHCCFYIEINSSMKWMEQTVVARHN